MLAGEQLEIAAGVCGVSSVASLLAFFGRLRRDRIIADTPAVRLRSAAQGYVRVEGVAKPPPDEDLRSPLSGRRCVWWDYRVEYRETNAEGERTLRTLEQATSVTPFVLSQEDGECLVGPVGAEVTPTIKDTWTGSSPRPMQREMFQAGLLVSNEGDYRYHEQLITEGTRLSVLGELRSHSEFGAVDQKTRDLLALWKRDQGGLLRRFDRNHDGRIDPMEWEVAQAAARGEAEAALLHSPIERVGVVAQTTHGQPFLIAPLDSDRLLRRERRFAAFFLIASAALLGACIFALSVA
jgi:E3 Ubiquitin ligase